MGRGMTNVSSEAKRKRRSWLGDITVRLVKEKPLGFVCAVVTLLMILIAFFHSHPIAPDTPPQPRVQYISYCIAKQICAKD